jgi:AcrR family transcriptional regulator
LYNLFENIDDLIVHLNGGTLDALYEAVAGVHLDNEPEAALRALARRYIRFTSTHPKLWSVLFEHSLPDGQEPPEWYQEKVRRLLGLVEVALAPLFPPGKEAERLHSARVLWSSLHGMCALASAGALAKTESLAAMADSLITNYLAGLRSSLPQSSIPEETAAAPVR